MRLREALEAVAAVSPEAFEDLRRGIDPRYPSLSGETTGPLSRMGRVCSRASAGGSVFDDTCSKIFAMRSRISACRASGSSPTGSGGPYTQ